MKLDFSHLNEFSNIEKYKEMISKQKDEIYERELIIESLMDSMCRAIRGIVLPYSKKMLEAAHSQQNKPAGENEMYKFVGKDLKERVFEDVKKAKLDHISSLNYDSCVYYFYFKYHGFMFGVAIPNVAVANKDNFNNMNYGQYRVMYEKNPGHWNTIKTSYDLDNLKDAVTKFVNSEKGE